MPRTRSRITWDYDKRLVLHLLRSEFDLTWKASSDIFISLFEEITATNVSNSLSSQYGERKLKQYWKDFYNVILTPEGNARMETSRNLISEKMAVLGIVDHKLLQASRSRPRGRKSKSSDAVPLSRQPPIAVLISPEPSPRTTQPSRKRARVEDDSSDDEIQVAAVRRHVRQQRVDRPKEGQVQVQDHRQLTFPPVLATPPQTPRAKQTYRQMDGKFIQISPEKDPYAKLVPVSDEEAHPPHCRNILLFRYDDGDSHNNSGGFTARRYRGRVQADKDPPSTLDWTDVFHHIDPVGKAQGYDSPVISVTSQMWWCFRLALKEMNKGARNGRIAIIDASALDPRAVYHALPFTRQLKKKHEFTGGAWNYSGTHEFLCFKEIPASAILSSLSVRELSSFVNGSPQMSKALRLKMLGHSKRAYFKAVLPALKADKVHLCPDVITAIAELMSFMGLDAFSKVEHLAHIWTNIIQGWGLQLSHQTPEQWQQLAARFARALADAGGHILPSRDAKPLELAFLEGVNWASCKNISFSARYARDSERLIRNKNRQARFIGLEDPARLLSDEGLPTRASKETLQLFRHQPASRGEVRENGEGSSQAAVVAAGRKLRGAIDLEIADEGSESMDDDGEEIQYDD